MLQQVAFIFPAQAQARRPAPDRSDATAATRVTQAEPSAAKVRTRALDEPGAPNISVTTLGTPVTQNFDTLPASGSATWTNDSTLPGWYHARTGTGTTIVANNGTSNAGNLYSHGCTDATAPCDVSPNSTSDRALGSLGSGNAAIGNLFWGVRLTNNTGSTITSLDVSHTGEQWRNSAAAAQTVSFSYLVGSPTVTGSLAEFQSAGVAVPQLDFTSPITGGTAAALNGNLSANRVTLTHTITGLSIPNGTDIMLRWSDPDHTGADHGLSIDDFSVTAQGAGGGGGVNLAINDVSQDEGSGGGTTAYTFTVSLSSTTHGGVTFDIATADGTAQDDDPAAEDNDYTAKSLTGQTIPNGSNSYQFTVDVNADATTEPNETFFVNVANVVGAAAADGQGQGTVVNDDVSLSLISQVQGSGTSSPLAGTTVSVRGVVTLLKSNGFFLQEEAGDNDSDPNTSEGIFVLTSSAPTAGVGDQATVTGTAVEFNGLTEIGTSNANVTVNSTGNALPTAVTLTAADLPPTAGFAQPQLEKYEGMRLTAASLTTVSPNDSFFDVSTVITGQPRPVREPGIPASDPIPPDPTTGTPDCCIPVWDENPERLLLDTNGRAGSTGEAITSNVVITNAAGPLDFALGQYRLINEAALTRTANMAAVAVPVPNTDEFAVASYNIENFDNNATQREKAALTVRDVLHYPDVIGAVEIFDLEDLQALRDEINADAVNAGDPDPRYEAYLIEADGAGGDNDQDVAFLVKTSRVQVNSVTQEREEETFINPNNGQPETLHDRPPLVLDATVDPSGANPRRVLVVVNHLRSFIDIELVSGEGARVREKRKKQAESLADLLNDLQAGNPGVPVISVGDYNAFEFSTGYDDPVSVIKGNPTPDDQIVVDQSPDLVEPGFFNLTDELPAAERYSFIFEHTAQGLDHHIVNAAARARNTRNAVARVNSDFPEVPAAAFTSDAARSERNSDHDPVVSYYSLGNAQAAGSLIISEFRFHGPGQAEELSPETGGGGGTPGGPDAPGTPAENDEFIEFYNNTDSDITVATLDGSAGWALVASDGQVRFIIPNGTIIPARHHLLAVNTDGYSLYDYALPDGVLLPDGVTEAGGYDLNILDESGIALFRTSNPLSFTMDERLDAVGYSGVPELYREGTGLPTTGLEIGGEQDYSWLRQLCAFVQGVGCTTPGIPKDSGFNELDFVSVDTSGATQSLGAPGPEGLSSPIQRNADFPATLLDTGRSAGAAPNRVRDLADTGQNKSFGTMSIRRTFTNSTGGPVGYLSFRVVQITTFPQTPAEADLRVLDSSDITVTRSNGTQADVRGTYVEQPPAQPNGGALNSSLGVGYINLEGNTIEDGETVGVQFLLGVEKTGTFRFYINVEACPSCDAEPKVLEARKGEPRVGVQGAARPRPRRARGRRR